MVVLRSPAVIGIDAMEVDEAGGHITISGVRVAAGDHVTIDGSTGGVFLGEAPLLPPDPTILLEGFTPGSRELSDAVDALPVLKMPGLIPGETVPPDSTITAPSTVPVPLNVALLCTVTVPTLSFGVPSLSMVPLIRVVSLVSVVVPV